MIPARLDIEGLAVKQLSMLLREIEIVGSIPSAENCFQNPNISIKYPGDSTPSKERYVEKVGFKML